MADFWKCTSSSLEVGRVVCYSFRWTYYRGCLPNTTWEWRLIDRLGTRSKLVPW